ncbi:hypothetical protein [Nocardia sp. NPDC052112]|uniref:VMAP-C domain-containing protein n=1 Tax=Nocardia sp. NPDC052112 TaxID=3155646 RepID=UPI00342951AF
MVEPTKVIEYLIESGSLRHSPGRITPGRTRVVALQRLTELVQEQLGWHTGLITLHVEVRVHGVASTQSRIRAQHAVQQEFLRDPDFAVEVGNAVDLIEKTNADSLNAAIVSGDVALTATASGVAALVVDGDVNVSTSVRDSREAAPPRLDSLPSDVTDGIDTPITSEPVVPRSAISASNHGTAIENVSGNVSIHLYASRADPSNDAAHHVLPPQAYSATSGLSGPQLLRLGRSILAVPAMMDPTGRVMISEAVNDPWLAVDDETSLLDALLDHLGSRGADGLLAALDAGAVNETERLSVRAARECWHRQQRIAPVLNAFQTATIQQIQNSYYRSHPPGDNVDYTPPSDLEEAMDHIADYGLRGNKPLPLHRFVAILEHLTGTQIEDSWFRLSANTLHQLRRHVTTASAHNARVVVDLRDHDAPFGCHSWPRTITGHLFVRDRGWITSSTQSDPSAQGARDAIAFFIDRAHQYGVAAFTLGLIVSRSMVDEVPETWLYGDALVESSQAWLLHPMVLHSAERLGNSAARARWVEKVAAIHNHLDAHLPEAVWIDGHHRDTPAAIRRVVQTTSAACFGLAFVTDAFGDNIQRDPLIATVAAGAPYVMWTNYEPEDWHATKALFGNLVVHGAFDDLPIRIHNVRTTATGPCSTIRMIWDHPAILPPMEPLLGLTAGD